MRTSVDKCTRCSTGCPSSAACANASLMFCGSATPLFSRTMRSYFVPFFSASARTSSKEANSSSWMEQPAGAQWSGREEAGYAGEWCRYA